MLWSEILQDEEFQTLDDAKKFRVLKGWYAENVETDPEYQALPREKQRQVFDGFLRDTGITTLQEAPKPSFWERALDLGGLRRLVVGEPKESIQAPTGEAIAEAQIRQEAQERGLPKERYISDTYPEGAKLKRIERFGQGIGVGMLGTLEGIAGGLQWLTDGKLGKDLANQAALWRAELTPEEIDFSDALASGIGSMATFFVPGLGIARGARAVAIIAPKLANWLGSSTAAAMEAMTEAGQVYRNVFQETQDMEKAEKAAKTTFWLNLPLLAVTNKLGIFAERGGALRRAAVASQMEGIQEAAQEKIASTAEGREVTLGNYIQAYGVGALTGALFGAAAGKLLPAPETETAKKDMPIIDVATGRVLSREEFEKPETQARPVQEQPAVAAPEGALGGLAAGKEVKEDAQRIRELDLQAGGECD